VPQSHVDLADPTFLDFPYVRSLADVVDALPPGPVAVVHVGVGAATLARYVAVTRPGSRQRAVEVDARLAELVRGPLGLSKVPGCRLVVGDGRAVVEALPADSADLVVVDAFAGARVPAHLTTVEFFRAVAAVLRPGGVVLVNTADGRPLDFARAEVATLAAVWPDVAVLAEPGVLRGRRFGNLVLAASAAPLPIAELARRATRADAPARVVAGDDLVRFASGARPATDATAVASPAPPARAFR
jgi:spermidine synthase